MNPCQLRATRTATSGWDAEELTIRRVYEVISILNDLCIAVWFIVGSVMYFSPDWATPGTWCFLLGSVHSCSSAPSSA